MRSYDVPRQHETVAERVRRLEETAVRLEIERRQRAAAPIGVGDLVRIRRTWDLGLIEAVEATWHGATYHVAVEEGGSGTNSGQYGRQELVPEE